MARISTIPASDIGGELGQTLSYTKMGIAQLTGRETARMIEPMEAYAHLPSLLQAYLGFEYASGQLDTIDHRTRALVELKAATMTQCEYCIDIGSNISRSWGLTDEDMLALPAYRTSPLFSDVEKLVLDYAAGMSRTPIDVSDDLVAALRRHFTDAQIVEMTHVVALENMRGRFNLALGIGSAGFSEGMVCAVPATT